jgi:hypothetical protein
MCIHNQSVERNDWQRFLRDSQSGKFRRVSPVLKRISGILPQISADRFANTLSSRNTHPSGVSGAGSENAIA